MIRLEYGCTKNSWRSYDRYQNPAWSTFTVCELENGDLVDLPSEKKPGGSVQFVFCERLPEGISTNQMDEGLD